MDAVLTRFLKELDSLESLINFFDKESSLLEDYALNPSDKVHISFGRLRDQLISFSTQKREYNYNSIIISLYGYLEKFIEDTLISSSARINKIFHDYDNIPEIIKERHLSLSLKLLGKISSNNSRSNLNTEQLIKNLNQCLNIKREFVLNNEAFSQHTFNFRINSIHDSFSNFGLRNFKDSVRKEEKLRKYFREIRGKQPKENITEEEAFSILEDLVERRNEVAHGVASQILSLNILKDYIIYFRHFSISLINTIANHINLIEVNELGTRLGIATEVLRNGTVLVLKNNYLKIQKGDILIGLGLESSVRARIINIQINGQDIVKTEETTDIEIGLLVDKKFKKKYNIYLIKNAT